MNFLSRDEIFNLVNALSEIGVKKIRLTGGEPMVRHDLIDIIKDIRSIKTIETIALTTNGYKLERAASDLINAGLDAINVSIDSLNPVNFKTITGHDKLNSILSGIDKISTSQKIKLKINAVLLNNLNSHELPLFLDLIKNKNLSVRFIELMRTGDNKEYFDKHHLSAKYIEDQIIKLGFILLNRENNQGPALEFAHTEYEGKIGLIAPYSKDFCKSCNRLRISARGNLRLCLFGDGGISLRPLLKNYNQKQELQETILRSLNIKPAAHNLIEGFTGSTKHLAQIGG